MQPRYVYSSIAFLISALLHAALWGLITNYTPEKPETVKNIPMQVSMFKQVVIPKPIVKKTATQEAKQPPAPPLSKPIENKSTSVKEKKKEPDQPIAKILPVKTIQILKDKPNLKPKKIAKASPKKNVTKVKKIKKKAKKKLKKKKPKAKVKKKTTKKPIKKRKPPQKVARQHQPKPKAITPRRPIRAVQKPQRQQRQQTKVAKNNAQKRAHGSRPAPQKKVSPRTRPPIPQTRPQTQPKPRPTANPQLEKQYGQSVKQHIERQKRYPKRAKRMRKQGVVKVGFTLNRSGAISNLRIVKSSGNSSLDKATLSAVKKVGRFPVFPTGIAKQSIRYIIPIAYKLR